jgi:hypothetical protein
VDDGKQLIQSSTVTQELRDCAEACRAFKKQREELLAALRRVEAAFAALKENT